MSIKLVFERLPQKNLSEECLMMRNPENRDNLLDVNSKHKSDTQIKSPIIKRLSQTKYQNYQ